MNIYTLPQLTKFIDHTNLHAAATEADLIVKL